MRLRIALLCYLVILLAASWWAWSTSEWLLFGVLPVLLLDRQAFRLLPWQTTDGGANLWVRIGCGVFACLAFYLAFWGIGFGEALYLGLGLSFALFLGELTLGFLKRLAYRARKPEEKPAWTERLVFASLILLVVLLLVFLSPLWAFHPLHMLPGDTPAVVGLDFEEVRVLTADGLELAGWLVPHPEARGNVIFCHGHAGNRAQGLGYLEDLHQLGFNVLLCDFRAHGQSPGHTARFGQGEVEDIKAAERYLNQRFPDQPLFIIGVSYGAAITMQALPQMPSVRAAWLECGFGRLTDVAQSRFAWVPDGGREALISTYDVLVRLDCGFWPSEVKPIDQALQVHIPLMICHGTADTFTPFTTAQELFDRYQGPKQHYWVPGAHHWNLRIFGKEYHQQFRAFFAERLKETATKPAAAASEGRGVAERRF